MEKIAIIGAGAVGAFYGSKLAQAGKTIFFQSRTLAQEKVRQLKIFSVWGDFTIKPNIFPDTNDMNPVDLIIISNKIIAPLKDVENYKKSLQKISHKKTVFLVLQNGINIEEYLSEYFPDNPILGGLAFTCINREKKGVIRHLDYGLVKIGSLRSKHNSIAKDVVNLMLSAGIQSEYSPNLRKARYEKLLWNVPFNSLSVVLSLLTDKLVGFTESRKLAYDLMKEVQKLAKKEKISIKESDIQSMLDKTEKMKPYHTSMYLDFLQKKNMESDAILGELLKIARKYKTEIPKIETMYLLLKSLEQRNLGK
jgi:2-dehydropantoate 2-reductase